MINFLKLIRYKNLLLIIITQYIIRWFIIFPVINYFNYSNEQIKAFCPCLKILHYRMQFSEINFLFLVFATVLLAAAGYVINDYFDRKTDMVNHPDTVIVDKSINSRTAIILHSVFSIVAILMGIYISYRAGHIHLSIIFILVAGILWFYSTTYKRQLLIGNFIVAILAALVPFIVIIFEIPMLYNTYGSIDCSCKLLIEYNVHQDFFNLVHSIKMTVFAYAFFAFMITLIREIIKDIEDLEGDETYGRKSLPVVTGVYFSKLVVMILTAITILSLAYIYLRYWYSINITFWYFLIALVMPLLFLIYKIARAQNKKDFHFASTLIKIIMLLGLVYSAIIFFKLFLLLK